ncbi:hypothetical protein N8I74_03715 [Chitiniphilus purpureus]|uniref:Acyl-homoserine-lactone synthase n=1 Tax=Chitiniphilus purpureus TaxID=2981137 RepID=A0ABY6DRN2_9NEIS|nr:acyl-homoserine-lactone synthase [Chitiniphilus sp. CD1]UXY16136.1 hypothetical protein N8I74_03715 [Chitiniphilus sp. CD1]
MDISLVRKGNHSFSSSDEHEMYRLRHQMFHDRLAWDVNTQDGLEFDDFDRLDPPYVIARDERILCGCWRILPTTGANMLRDVFPQLLCGAPAPCGEDIWELSRFAVLRQKSDAFGFSRLPLQMMEYIVQLARQQGITQLVTVTTAGLERLLRHAGLRPRRLGPMLSIGVARTIALSFDTSEATLAALTHSISACAPPAADRTARYISPNATALATA